MAEQPVAIHTRYDFYVPAFEVKIKGQSLERDVLRDVISVSYTDNLGKMDSCELTLNNWDAEKRDFKYIDTDLFDPGKEIELYMGYYDRGGLTLMLRGTIVTLSPDFPGGGQPTLQVRAVNQLYRLHFKQENLFFQDKTDSQIAQEFVSSVTAFEVELVTTSANSQIKSPREYALINNDYPIVYLMDRARANGYEIYLESVEEGGRTVSKLHFHPPEQGAPLVYKLGWGQSLMNFKPSLRTKGQVAKVTARGWNPTAGEEVTGEATWNDLEAVPFPNPDDLAAVDSALAGSEEVVADRPITTQDEAKAVALAHLRDLAKDTVTGSGSTVGLPELRAGRPVYIEKLGRRYSGRYVVTTSTHAIGESGYTTNFEARKEEPK